MAEEPNDNNNQAKSQIKIVELIKSAASIGMSNNTIEQTCYEEPQTPTLKPNIFKQVFSKKTSVIL